MNALIRKELRFTAQPISYLFLAFSLMTLLPGYPILVGTFFLGLGLFQSFLAAREQNDLLYTVLLPIRKRDAVTARFVHAAVVELGAFLLCAALTAVRMTLLRGAAVYRANAMMNANLVYLGWVLLLDAALNVLLVGGFFRTGWRLGGPFLRFGAAVLLLIAAADRAAAGCADPAHRHEHAGDKATDGGGVRTANCGCAGGKTAGACGEWGRIMPKLKQQQGRQASLLLFL